MPDQTLRILLGDTHLESRAVLEAICREQGWELTAVESSFPILRLLRDGSNVSLVMVDPTLPGLGISGRDVARTIKSTAQFPPVPVIFVLHAGVDAPGGIPVDGSVEIDGATPARVLAAIRSAMSGDAADPRPAEVPGREEGSPDAARGPSLAAAVVLDPGPAPRPAAGPGDAPSSPSSAEPLAHLREEVLAEVRSTVDDALNAFARTEGRAIAEEAVHRAAATQARDLAKQVAAIARETTGDTVDRVERLEYALAAMRGVIEAAQQAAEEARTANAQRIEAATAREAVGAAIREYLAGEGQTAVEPIVATFARAVVPPLAERFVQQHLEELPRPTATLGELLPRVQEELLEEARRVADRVARQQVEAMGATIRQSIAASVEEVIRGVARELVPTVVERLINDEIVRLRTEHKLD